MFYYQLKTQRKTLLVKKINSVVQINKYGIDAAQ